MRHLLLVVFALSCGRTPFDVEGEPKAPAVNEAPLFVFKGDGCPQAGVEADLTPSKNDGLALVRTRPQEECSGAGGEWFIGREEGTTRDYFAGDHACYFFPQTVRDSMIERFAVVRYMQTAALFHAPTGWCIRDQQGDEPVTTDSKNLAWGVYATEAGARAAYERLKLAQ
jgi:hypothetical protein